MLLQRVIEIMQARLEPGFRLVDRSAFDTAVAEAPLSELMREQYARYCPVDYDGWYGPDYRIHDGDLVVDGNLANVGFNTLITGAVHVTGAVSLANPYDDPHNLGFDEGGLFIVAGGVRCAAFMGEYGKCIFIDGDLDAREIVVNCFGDSSLVIAGLLQTHFFLGMDMWAEVGIGATMEYGIGYCLPIGYDEHAPVPIRPRHDEHASKALLDVDLDADSATYTLRRSVFHGEPIFKV